MRKFDPKPICEKCGTRFELAVWGPRMRPLPEDTAPSHYVYFISEVPQKVAENGDVLTPGTPEHLSIMCPVCGYVFQMQTAEQFQADEPNPADLYVAPGEKQKDD